METDRIDLQALTESLPPSLFATPLDRIFADHFRQRTLCRVFDRIAEGAATPPVLIGAAVRFLATQIEVHWTDEEDDLFPLLRSRATADDRIQDILTSLARDHDASRLARDRILDGLGRIDRAGGTPAPALAAMLHDFATRERRHLCLENAIVLPIARARLGHQDLVVLGQRMAARRGVPLVMTEYVK